MGKKDNTKKAVLHRRKPISKFKKVVIFLIAQLLLAFSVLLMLITQNQTTYQAGDSYYGFTVHEDIFASDEVFEDSNVFDNLFNKSMDDVIYLSVIKHQFEEKGLFSGKKQVDITNYAHRRDMAGNNDITAVFYLEDLLKWANAGVDYEDAYVSIYNYGVSAENLDMNVQIPEYAHLKDKMGNYIPDTWMLQPVNYALESDKIFDVTEDGMGNYYGHTNILKNKYRTIDGKNIDQLVNNWADYYTLIDDLNKTINNVYTNYIQYQWLGPLYFEGNTNVLYCVRMTDSDGKKVYHTNIEDADKLKERDLDKYFEDNSSKYMYYSPNDLIVQTNTGIRNEDIRAILISHDIEYAYPDDSKIWIGIDKNYSVEDEYFAARKKFNSKALPTAACAIGSIVCLAFFAGLMIYLAVKTGWVKTEEGETVLELNGADDIPLEIFLGICALLSFLLYLIAAAFTYDFNYIETIMNSLGAYTLPVFGVCFFVLACMLGVVFLSLIRRCKAGTLLSNSLVAILGKKVVGGFEKASGHHPGSLMIILSYILFLIVNFVAVVFAVLFMDYSEEIVGFLIIVLMTVIDIAIGLFHVKCRKERFEIIAGIDRIRNGETNFKINPSYMHGTNVALAEAANHIGDGIHAAVETSMKDEKMKADLITNVSHDIKTPLTSIINYVDLLKRENIQDEKVKGYIKVLDEKSQRLKHLTVDLVEASKISSGNVVYEMKNINFPELINQAVAEFSDKFEEKGLNVVAELECDNPIVVADSRHMWRIIENLLNNVCKYAMPQTRIYINLKTEEIAKVLYTWVSIKNISAQALNINANELTERFIRGDVSRSSEGSGLGLSIAKSLTEGQNGKFNIYLDGDLFKVTVAMPASKE